MQVRSEEQAKRKELYEQVIALRTENRELREYILSVLDTPCHGLLCETPESPEPISAFDSVAANQPGACVICGDLVELYAGGVIVGEERARRIHVQCGEKADLFKLGLARRVFQRLPAEG